MSNTRRRKRTTMAAAAIGSAGASALLAMPADAHHKQQCPGDTVCVWEHGKRGAPGDDAHGFNGQFHWIGPHSRDLHYDACPGCVYLSDGRTSLNDSISAVWNNSNTWYKFFQDTSGGGQTICFAPGAAAPDLINESFPGPPLDWNNKISGGEPGGPSQCGTTVSRLGCSI
jgi:hypothetical protein